MIITDYALIQNDDPQKLVDEVNNFINKGWQPLGGVSHRTTQLMGYEYCQALVMYQGMKRLD